jgi:glucan phosphoethanolaminetransferase (alkaline phosphatase superfamily)
MFISGREKKDVLYTATLPIRKSDAVKARCLFMALIELAEVLLCALVAVIKGMIYKDVSNAAGIDANPAFFGLALIMLALFNIIFIPAFYKTAYRAGMPFIFGCIAMAIYIVAAESLVWIPSPIRAYLDTTDPAITVKQLPILIAGIAVWLLVTCAAYKKGAKNFEKVDI